MSKRTSRRNGKLGGRPSYDKDTRAEIPNLELVILTANQYSKLIKKYGKTLFYASAMILNNWLRTSPKAEKYRGKNNYAHFRSDGWVINTAKGVNNL